MVGLGPVPWDLDPLSGPAGPRGLGERRQCRSRLREASGAGRPGPPWVTVLKRGPAQAGVLGQPPARSARPQACCFVTTQLSPPGHALKFGSCPMCPGLCLEAHLSSVWPWTILGQDSSCIESGAGLLWRPCLPASWVLAAVTSLPGKAQPVFGGPCCDWGAAAGAGRGRAAP